MRPTVTLRGVSGDEQGRTLVLMNGVPMNTSDEGGVNWNRLNPYSIGKIEIFKGPGSSLYGNNAMGGVINIITRKPEKGFEADAGISYGTFNTFKPELWMGGSPDQHLTRSLSGFYQSSDGYNNVPESMRGDPELIASVRPDLVLMTYGSIGGAAATCIYRPCPGTGHKIATAR